MLSGSFAELMKVDPTGLDGLITSEEDIVKTSNEFRTNVVSTSFV